LYIQRAKKQNISFSQRRFDVVKHVLTFRLTGSSFFFIFHYYGINTHYKVILLLVVAQPLFVIPQELLKIFCIFLFILMII